MSYEELKDPFHAQGCPYPGLEAELTKLPHPYIIIVKDPEGMYCRETLAEADPTLELAAQTVCLASIMIAGWMLENHGYDRCREFINLLHSGLLAFLADDDRYEPQWEIIQ